MSNAFVVMPMNQKVSLEPGSTYTGSITVANPSDAEGDFAYKVSVAPYGVVGEEYKADLATKSNRSMMVDWITVDKNAGVLKPNETVDINFTIKVPESAPAGGQYASIMVTEDAEVAASQGLSLNSVFEMASLIYADVAGETVQGGEIQENTIPGFVTSTPVTVEALITNTGNIHQTATIVLEVKDLFTGKVILPTEQNAGRYSEVIMPETTRRTSYDVVDLPAVGIVGVTQTIYYNGETSAETKNVIICPVWFMVVMLILLVGVVSGIIALIKSRRKKRAMI